MSFFKKKCAHKWSLSDYKSYVDVSLSFEEEYILSCVKCDTKRVTHKNDYLQMRNLGLIS